MLRQSLVNHPAVAEKILKFLASRRGQNVFPRLKGHNQNSISWRDVFNMLKGLRKSDLVSSVSGASLPAFFSIVFRIPQQSLTQFFSSHWHDYMTVKIIFFFCADTILQQCYFFLNTFTLTSPTSISWNHLPTRVKVLMIQLMFIS